MPIQLLGTIMLGRNMMWTNKFRLSKRKKVKNISLTILMKIQKTHSEQSQK
jgi:hypothetical protein